MKTNCFNPGLCRCIWASGWQDWRQQSSSTCSLLPHQPISLCDSPLSCRKMLQEKTFSSICGIQLWPQLIFLQWGSVAVPEQASPALFSSFTGTILIPQILTGSCCHECFIECTWNKCFNMLPLVWLLSVTPATIRRREGDHVRPSYDPQPAENRYKHSLKY